MSIHPGLHRLYDASKDIPLLVLKTDSCIHCLVTSKSHSITRTVSIQKGDQSSNQYRYKTVMSRNVKDLLVQVQTGTVEEEEESQKMKKEEVQVLLLGSGHDAVED